MNTSSPSDHRGRNRLLAAIPVEDYDRLSPHLEFVSLGIKDVIYEPEKPIRNVYFPLDGVCSILSVDAEGRAVEVATVGNEGMVGLPVFLGATSSPGLAFSQIPGQALRMDAASFRELVTPGTPLHSRLQRYTEALFNMVAQGSACNRLHTIRQRCARWLLMSHDRVGRDEFELTQEFLSDMLGVRRASVSEVAGELQSDGFITYTRGVITILDRAGLERTSCSCYQIIKREFDRVLD